MKAKNISDNTLKMILQAMNNTESMSTVTTIVKQAKTEQEIIQNLKAEKLID